MGLISNGTTVFDAGAMSAGFGGAMTFIKKLTASSSATLSFVNGASSVVLDNTYKSYLFVYNNIHPATNSASLTFQGSIDTGSNYNVAITSTLFQGYHKEDGSGGGVAYNTANDQAQGTSFQVICQGIGNDNDECGCGSLHLFNPSSTTFVKNFIGRGSNSFHQDFAEDENSAGYFNNTSAIDAIQFKMSSGNIDAGTITLYGIA